MNEDQVMQKLLTISGIGRQRAQYLTAISLDKLILTIEKLALQ